MGIVLAEVDDRSPTHSRVEHLRMPHKSHRGQISSVRPAKNTDSTEIQLGELLSEFQQAHDLVFERQRRTISLDGSLIIPSVGGRTAAVYRNDDKTLVCKPLVQWPAWTPDSDHLRT